MTKLPEFLADPTYDNSVGRMVRQLTNRLKTEMSSKLEAVDMNVNEYYVFLNVSGEEGMSQTDLAKRMSMPPYAISRLIDSMIVKGLVERRANPHSRRAFCIFLTQDAKAKIPKVMGSLADINDWILAPLDATERAAFVSALRKLV